MLQWDLYSNLYSDFLINEAELNLLLQKYVSFKCRSQLGVCKIYKYGHKNKFLFMQPKTTDMYYILYILPICLCITDTTLL